MKGHLKITKVYDDHEEVVIDESNILTEGFKIDVVSVLTGRATEVPSIVPGYFQVGDNSVGYEHYATSPIGGFRHASSVFFKLSAPFEWDEYGRETYFQLENLNRAFLASAAATTGNSEEIVLSGLVPVFPWRDPFVPSAITVSSTTEKEWFITLDQRNLTKFFLDSVSIRLEIGKESANGKNLKEFGLFSKSAFSYKRDTPLLCAYKNLDTAISKTDAFKVLIDWDIGFLGNTNIYDTITPGRK